MSLFGQAGGSYRLRAKFRVADQLDTSVNVPDVFGLRTSVDQSFLPMRRDFAGQSPTESRNIDAS
jgi:hypothetical protein